MSESMRLTMALEKQWPDWSKTALKITCHEVCVVEQATYSNLPVVCFKIEIDGKVHLLTLTGRIVNCIAAAVKGANQRNHGVPEP